MGFLERLLPRGLRENKPHSPFIFRLLERICM
jgi:hypothetical protein